MTVRQLARVLKQKPLEIAADLMELAVLANIEQLLPFDVIVRVARKHGYIAKRTA